MFCDRSLPSMEGSILKMHNTWNAHIYFCSCVPFAEHWQRRAPRLNELTEACFACWCTAACPLTPPPGWLHLAFQTRTITRARDRINTMPGCFHPQRLLWLVIARRWQSEWGVGGTIRAGKVEGAVRNRCVSSPPSISSTHLAESSGIEIGSCAFEWGRVLEVSDEWSDGGPFASPRLRLPQQHHQLRQHHVYR